MKAISNSFKGIQLSNNGVEETIWFETVMVNGRAQSCFFIRTIAEGKPGEVDVSRINSCLLDADSMFGFMSEIEGMFQQMLYHNLRVDMNETAERMSTEATVERIKEVADSLVKSEALSMKKSETIGHLEQQIREDHIRSDGDRAALKEMIHPDDFEELEEELEDLREKLATFFGEDADLHKVANLLDQKTKHAAALEINIKTLQARLKEAGLSTDVMEPRDPSLTVQKPSAREQLLAMLGPEEQTRIAKEAEEFAASGGVKEDIVPDLPSLIPSIDEVVDDAVTEYLDEEMRND